jgi:endonuclease/exonuclease/phosphatase family metal-dependent hydrolase
VRVATSNLQHGLPDPVGRPALGLAFAPLRKLAADVYALQELDHRRWRTRFEHQGERMGGALAGELVWALAKRWLFAGQANALVVRGSVEHSTVLALPGSGERRIAIVSTVVVDGERWTVGTTHLSLNPYVADRQLDTTLDFLSTRPKPLVLLGDLNLRPERVALVAERTGYQLLDGPPTINARRGLNRRLDHVLVQGATIIDSGVLKLPVSDHLTVWADLEPT